MAEFSSDRLTKFDYKMFERAKEVASKSDFSGGAKVGCVMVYHHKVIAEACNSDKTCPQQKYWNRKRTFRNLGGRVKHKAHAETEALKSIPYPVAQNIKWKDVDVYLFRVAPGLSMGQGLSRCCPSCMAMLRDKGIRHIFYSTEYGFAYENISKR